MNTQRFVLGLGLGLALTLVLLGAVNTLTGPVYAQTGGSDTPKEKVAIDGSHPPLPSPGVRAANAANGDFENGPDGSWVEYSAQGWPLVVSSTTLSAIGVTPHSGNWAVWLGGGDNEVAYISQTLTVPAGQSMLSFWKWISSGDLCGYDFGSVRINNTTVANLDLCDSANTSGWEKSTINLSAYAGQSVQLQIRAETDGSLNSNLFIDDVTFESASYTYLPLINKNFCSEFPGYFDDFSDPDSGWYTGDDVDHTWGYVVENEEYQILLKNLDTRLLVTPDLVLPANYRVEVDTRQATSNPGDNGLVFGIRWGTDTYEGYTLLVNPDDQTYWLNKRWMDGSDTVLRNWLYSPTIQRGSNINHLRVDRVGSTIRLYINGTLVTTVTDGSFTGAGRDAGVVAYTYQVAPIDMRFDNFQASCTP